MSGFNRTKTSLNGRLMIMCIYILDIHWLQISFQGRFWFWFLSIFCKFDHFKIKLPFQEQTYHFMFSFLSHVESARVFPPFSRVFPPFSREFPPRKIDKFSRKVEQNQPRRYEIQNWPQESKNDNFQLLHKKSALRARYIYIYICIYVKHISVFVG